MTVRQNLAAATAIGWILAAGVVAQAQPRPASYETAARASSQSGRQHVAVAGSVSRPGVYAIDGRDLRLSQLLAEAGGPAEGPIRLYVLRSRGGEQFTWPAHEDAEVYDGDIVVAEKLRKPVAANQPRRAYALASIVCINLIRRPVVIEVPVEFATTADVVRWLGQRSELARSLRVIHCSSTSQADVSNPMTSSTILPDGAVIVFDRELVHAGSIPADAIPPAYCCTRNSGISQASAESVSSRREPVEASADSPPPLVAARLASLSPRLLPRSPEAGGLPGFVPRDAAEPTASGPIGVLRESTGSADEPDSAAANAKTWWLVPGLGVSLAAVAGLIGLRLRGRSHPSFPVLKFENAEQDVQDRLQPVRRESPTPSALSTRPHSSMAPQSADDARLLKSLIRNELPAIEEPVSLPAVVSLFGCPRDIQPVRVDDVSPLAGPHFGRQPRKKGRVSRVEGPEPEHALRATSAGPRSTTIPESTRPSNVVAALSAPSGEGKDAADTSAVSRAPLADSVLERALRVVHSGERRP